MKTAALTKRWGGCRFEVGLYLPRAQRPDLWESASIHRSASHSQCAKGLAEQVSATRIENDIRGLAGFGTRHTLSETESDTRGIGAARRWSVRVGDVKAHTLKNIVIDNYLFGVSSMNKDGIGSPVVFPGPVGSVRYD